MKPEATQAAVVEFLGSVQDLELWIDGGWGVDALLEVQRRSHTDLDIIVSTGTLDAILERLATLGYRRRDAGELIYVSLRSHTGHASRSHTAP